MAGMLEQMLAKRRALTPQVGANLCEVDDFEFPPDNIRLLGHYDSAEVAQQIVRSPENKNRALIVIEAE